MLGGWIANSHHLVLQLTLLDGLHGAVPVPALLGGAWGTLLVLSHLYAQLHKEFE